MNAGGWKFDKQVIIKHTIDGNEKKAQNSIEEEKLCFYHDP